MPNYPTKALQEYVLKSDLLGGVLGIPGAPGADGPPGANGAQGASWTPVQSATAPATVSTGTIATAGVTVSRVAPTVDITAVVLASGTIAGQEVAVLNESAFSITFAAVGTSHVATGTACVIYALTAQQFMWDSVTTRWYQISSLLASPPAGTGTFGSGTMGSGTMGG